MALPCEGMGYFLLPDPGRVFGGKEHETSHRVNEIGFLFFQEWNVYVLPLIFKTLRSICRMLKVGEK